MQLSDVVKEVLERYRKPDCKVGRITSSEDYKHLARKVFFRKEGEGRG